VLCRTIEAEIAAIPPRENEMDLRFHYLSMLSDQWVSSAYAICYVLWTRKLLIQPAFEVLQNDLRLVRVQNEKYELPSDKKLKEPLQFAPNELRPDETEPPIYVYDKDDPTRAHIPRMGLSEGRSVMWEVFDVSDQTARWLERRELADRMLSVLSALGTSSLKPEQQEGVGHEGR
jgi:hypothetical protein